MNSCLLNTSLANLGYPYVYKTRGYNAQCEQCYLFREELTQWWLSIGKWWGEWLVSILSRKWKEGKSAKQKGSEVWNWVYNVFLFFLDLLLNSITCDDCDVTAKYMNRSFKSLNWFFFYQWGHEKSFYKVIKSLYQLKLHNLHFLLFSQKRYML